MFTPEYQNHCYALVIESSPPSISIWDIDRTGPLQTRAVTGRSALCGRWATAAVADFAAMQAVVATANHTVQLWDLRRLGEPVAVSDADVYGGRGALLHAFHLSGERPMVVSGGLLGSLSLLDATGSGGKIKTLRTLSGHTAVVHAGQIYVDHQHVQAATLDATGQALFWHVPIPEDFCHIDGVFPVTAACNAEPEGRGNDCRNLPDEIEPEAVSDSGDEFADDFYDGGKGEAIEVPNPSGGTADRGIVDFQVPEQKVRLLPDTEGSQVRVVAVRHEPTPTLEPQESEWEFEEDVPIFAITGGADGQIRAWIQSRSGKVKRTSLATESLHEVSASPFLGHSDQVLAISADFEAALAVTAAADATVRVWGWRGHDMASRCVLRGHRGSVRKMVTDFRTCGRAITGGADEELCIWDLGINVGGLGEGEGACLGRLRVPGAAVQQIHASFTHELAAATTRGGQMRVWDLRSLEPLAVLDTHPYAVFALMLPEGLSSAAVTGG